jgi:hypothetical protein
MRRLVLALAVALLGLASAAAQVTTKGPSSDKAITPAEMERRLEDQAERVKKIAPRADRVALVDFAWPIDAAEYRANSKYIIVLVVAVSHDEKELPVKQVYVRADGRDVALEKIASDRRAIPESSPVASVIGRFREDSFFLAPASAMMRKGDLLIDFAINRTGFRVYQLPGTPPAFVLQDRDPDPTRGAKPDTAARRRMIEREYPGFKLP